jgi:putative heme transporter
MLALEEPCGELSLPALDVRGLGRRLAIVAVGLAAVGALLALAAPHLHTVEHALARAVTLQPAWGAVAIGLEAVSLAGYVILLAGVAGRSTQRIGIRESAAITFAGTAATRVLPTAGAGGAALTLWTLRRAGLRTRAATRTLLTFLVLLYAVFLGSIVVSGGALGLGLAHSHGPAAVGVVPAALAVVVIVVALALAARRPRNPRSRAGRTLQLLGESVSDALALVRSGDPRMAGAVIYWLFDAAVLWAMLHAFGSSPSLLVVMLAYFVGQAATTLPLPGSVSGGMAGVLIVFGVPAVLALPAVLAYRTVAVWLPVPGGVAALSSLRSMVARWAAGRQVQST